MKSKNKNGKKKKIQINYEEDIKEIEDYDF